MNESIRNMLERRSVRSFKSDMIPSDILELILEAGKHAPTGRGNQSPIIIAVTNKEIAEALASQSGNNVDKKKISLDADIKSHGTYEATVKLHPGISAVVKVVVCE